MVHKLHSPELFSLFSLFRTSAKCSFHLFFTPSSFVSRMPSLLLTESVLLAGLLQSCLVASNTAFILPVFAAFSASLAIWSIQFLLSLLSCFLTSSLYTAFSLSDLVESTLDFTLSSIFFQLVALSQGLLCFFLFLFSYNFPLCQSIESLCLVRCVLYFHQLNS